MRRQSARWWPPVRAVGMPRLVGLPLPPLAAGIVGRYNREAITESCVQAGSIRRGRTGFDRMGEVFVACRGWSVGHVKS